MGDLRAPEVPIMPEIKSKAKKAPKATEGEVLLSYSSNPSPAAQKVAKVLAEAMVKGKKSSKSKVSEKEVVGDYEAYLLSHGYSETEAKGVVEKNEATLQANSKRAAESKRVENKVDPWDRMSLADKVAFEKDAASRRGVDPQTITAETVAEVKKSREVAEVKEKRSASPGKVTPPAEKVENAAGAEVTKSASGMFRIFTQPVTAIFRFMGSAGWTHKEAMTAIKGLGIPDGEVSEGTARIQMNAGKKGGDCGGRGPVPTLTPEQVKSLDTAAGRVIAQVEVAPVKKGKKGK